jgi:hypothetical protein
VAEQKARAAKTPHDIGGIIYRSAHAGFAAAGE